MTTKERKKPRRNHTITISDGDDEVDLYPAEPNTALRQVVAMNGEFYHPQQDDMVVDLNPI